MLWMASVSAFSLTIKSLAALTQEQLHRRISRLLPVAEADAVQVGRELRAIRRFRLERDQHAAPGGTMVAVVEQGDVPAAAETVQETQQRTGRSGNSNRHGDGIRARVLVLDLIPAAITQHHPARQDAYAATKDGILSPFGSTTEQWRRHDV